MANKPILSFKDGALSVAVFEWKKEGQKPSYTFNVQRSFKKDKDKDEWTTETLNCFPEECVRLSTMLYGAYLDTLKHKAGKDTSTAAPSETPVKTDDEIPF